MIVPHDNLTSIKDFKVLPITDIIETNGLKSIISERCKPPDHSILYCVINYFTSSEEEIQTNINEHINYQEKVANPKRRFFFNDTPDDFMKSDLWKQSIANIIKRIELRLSNQENIDKNYELLCRTNGRNGNISQI